MHEVAEKVGDLGTIGAIAAAIAALTLACRMRGPKLDVAPTGFPKDGNAALEKYQRAFVQLVAKSDEAKNMEQGQSVKEAEVYGKVSSSAVEYAMKAFAESSAEGKSDNLSISGGAKSGEAKSGEGQSDKAQPNKAQSNKAQADKTQSDKGQSNSSSSSEVGTKKAFLPIKGKLDTKSKTADPKTKKERGK